MRYLNACKCGVKLVFFIVLVSLFSTTIIVSQDRVSKEPEKVTSKEVSPLGREVVEITTEYRQNILFDWGGWMRHQFVTFGDKPTNAHRSFVIEDIRLWGAFNILEQHNVYLRLKTQYIDWAKGDSGSLLSHDFIGPNLDQGFYSFKITKDEYLLGGTIGRQTLDLGYGTALLGVYDGLKLDVSVHKLDFNIFAAKTITSENDIDQSRPDADHSRRNFFGLQLKYKSIGRNDLNLFFLKQVDCNRETPENVNQDFDYNSQYLGLGLTGQLFTNALYHLETIYEWGESTPNGVENETEDIKAFSVIAGINFLLNARTRPRLEFEYLFGSGDSDRKSVTNTVNGNTAGTKDNNFLYFGFVQTGYSLYPQLSNIHIFRSSFKFSPFAKPTDEESGRYQYLEKMNISLDLYSYMKDKKSGVISDVRADRNNRFIGMEADLTLRWKIFSDLSINLAYARFFPGSAYSERKDRDFFSFTLYNEF